MFPTLKPIVEVPQKRDPVTIVIYHLSLVLMTLQCSCAIFEQERYRPCEKVAQVLLSSRNAALKADDAPSAEFLPEV